MQSENRDAAYLWDMLDYAHRNVIVHEYGEIKQDRIWALAENKDTRTN